MAQAGSLGGKDPPGGSAPISKEMETDMTTRIETMSGEELLLMRILGSPEIQPVIAQELDRRSLLGRRQPKRSPSRERPAAARTGGRLVA